VPEGQLTVSVDIVEANDNILAEIAADLHFDFEQDFDGIDEAMNTADRHKRGFVSCTLVIAERDVGRSLDIGPMI
jgi:hypothetical protein